MKLAFMGSPAFAVPALQALADAGHQIAAVYCQPPRPAGRGHGVVKCPVHQAADAMGLAVRTPPRLKKDLDAQKAFADLQLNAAVVAAYGLILPQAMLDAPARGCLNIHASLLPRWRGAAPIHAAIMAGDSETGVTIMQMDAGLDTGAMLLRGAVPIGPHSTTPDLLDALAALGATLVVRALAEHPAPTPQPDIGATYAAKLTREDGKLDFTRDAASLDRQVRALTPWPGTYASYAGELLKILSAQPEAGCGTPGAILDDGFLVACGTGCLRLTKVQRPGRAATSGEAFLRGSVAWRGSAVA